jgi:hypothetical protein
MALLVWTLTNVLKTTLVIKLVVSASTRKVASSAAVLMVSETCARDE